MDIFYYRGLNCRLACLINIAHSLGVNHTEAFATLWSETDFADEAQYNIYASKRVYDNLNAMGIMIEPSARYARDAFFLIGADTFYIPWHTVYGHFHEPHYLFAQAGACYDPVYNENGISMEPLALLPYSFELSRVYRIEATPPKREPANEAAALMRALPDIGESLRVELQACADGGDISALIKRVTAMINNRYLFRQYLYQSSFAPERPERYFDAPYFSRWEAVRNGLHKAFILKDNSGVIDEVGALLDCLMHEEAGMARGIAGLEPRAPCYIHDALF